eukprot:TRINITY_DN24077_c0_g1_i4.p1 TRINITY_DN24077_c0_g1~~TRINITY_DN24077_c0_g1_i4.p1  ORF type:complete len:383 (-),score=62.72 TRINITY_DN24077_c0_g1_i4:331-1479(-)
MALVVVLTLLALLIHTGVPENLPQPEGCVIVTAASTTCIGLEWPAVDDASAYEVWSVRSSDDDVQLIYEGSELAYTFTEATSSSNYTFVYKAVNADGASPASRQSTSTSTASHKSRYLYVSDHTGDRVLKFYHDGQFYMEFVRPQAGGLSRPWGIAQGPNGDVFVASGGTSNVLQYRECTGNFVRMFAYVPGQPRGLGFHAGPDGDTVLYVGSHFYDKILMYDAGTGNALGMFASVKSPWALAWNAAPGTTHDDLFVTSGDTVMRFNQTNGTFVSKYIDKRVSYAAGMTFSASSEELFVTGPYAGKLIAVFKASSNETVARFSGLYQDQYMQNCQGLVRYNDSLFAACRDQIRSYDSETGEFLSVWANFPNMLSSFLLFLDE